VQGDAGIGKSWLLRLMRSRLGAAAVTVGAPPFLTGLLRSGVDLLAGERDPAFLAAARQLYPDGPWIPTLLEAGAPTSKEEVQLALAHALGRTAWERGGVCLLLEDLHEWSGDDLSALRVLLLRAVSVRAPLLMVATSRRPLDADWWQEAIEAARAGGLGHVDRLSLASLPIDGVRALIAEVLGTDRLPEALGSWLFERTMGHPLHTVELLRFLVEGGSLANLGPAWQFRKPPDGLLPLELEGVLDLRLEQARADQELWEALSVLAVLERAAELHEWGAVSGMPAELLVELGGEAARLGLVRLELENGRESYVLAHPLYPSRLRSKLPRAVRRALHSRAAEVARDPGERARHARLGRHAKAAEWSREALVEARGRFAYAEVQAHAEALLSHAGEADRQRGQVLYLWGEALFYQGEFERAEQALDESDESEAAWLRAVALRRLGRLEEGLALVEREAELVPEPLRGRLQALRVSLLLQLGREEQGRRLLGRLLDVAEPGSYARAILLLESGRDLHRGARYSEALTVTEEAALVFREVGDTFELFRALNNIGIYASQLGHWDRSEHALREAIALAEARGNRVYTSSRHLNLGSLWLRRGRYRSAEEAYEAALRLGESSADREVISSALTSLAEVRFLRGELPSALELHRRGLAELEKQGMHVIADLYRLVLGQIEVHCGVPAAATRALLDAENLGRHPLLPLMKADALLLSGRAEEAEAVLASSRPADVRATVKAEYALGRSLVQIALGKSERARAEVSAAFELLEGTEHQPLLGLATMQLALLERLAGHDAESRRLAVRALRLLETESAWGHLLTLERLVPLARAMREEAAALNEPGAAGGQATQEGPLDGAEVRGRPFLRMLGRFELEQDGRVVAWKARKARELLALLLITAHREGGPWIARERIIGELWPESEGTQAEFNFRATLKRLREALGAAGRVERNPEGAYRLELPRCDVARFLQALAGGDLEAAVGWYGGELLPGVDLPGVEVVRERLRARFRTAAHSLVAGQAGARATELHQRLLDDDPFDLMALRGLVDSLRCQADDGRAQRTLELVARRYQEELGELPQEVTDILKSVRRDQLSR
jgi:DNA-binding SARP family transcriptional activator